MKQIPKLEGERRKAKVNRKIVLMAVLALMFAAIFATHAVPTAKAEEIPLERHWIRLKKMYGGGVYKVVIVIDAGGTLYCSAGGVYKSIDGGRNWVSAQGDLTTRGVGEIAADPFRPDILYVATDQGLFKTTDGGLTWVPSGVGLPVYQVRVIVIDPKTPDTVYVGTGHGIYKSTDGGATWVAKNSGLAITGWAGGLLAIQGLAIDPQDTSRLYANTYRSYFHISTNGGESWTPVQSLWGDPIVVSRSDPDVLYSTSGTYWSPTFKRNPIIKSTNKGVSWVGVTPPIGPYDLARPTIDPTNANVVYAATEQGVYKSTDGAATWTNVLQLAGIGYMNIVTIDPVDPSILYVATGAQGVYKSTDAGASWVQASTGIANVHLPDIDVNNADPSQIYAAVRQEGLLKSVDSGENWDTVGFEGIGISTVATHPTNPSIVFVDGWDPSSSTGIWKSTDGGETWRGVYGEPAYHVAFHPLDPSKIFASIHDTPGGILMSTDGGENWFNPQWHYIYPHEYAFHPTDPNKIWVGYGQYWGPPVYKMGIAYSTDGGWHWTRVQFGYGSVGSLVVDPNNPTTLYAAGGGIYGGVDYSGVWKSIDSGRTWTKKNTGLVNTHVGKLVLDGTTGSLYASTPQGVFLSEDGAESWSSISPISELRDQRVSSMALTPDGTRLYACTNGGIYVFAEFEVNTPIGTDVTVTDPVSGVTVKFAEVTSSGVTIVTTSDIGPTPPIGFRIAGVYYEITTTADYTGTIEIAIPYDPAQVKGLEKNLKLKQWDPVTAGWKDVTTWVDEVNNVIYGQVTSLSIFAVIESEDVTPPVTAITLSDSLGDCGWYVSDVTVTLTATDDISGVAETAYRFDGATWITYTEPFAITEEGIITVYYNSTDKAGNVEATKSETIKIDKTPPTTDLTIGTHYIDGADNVYVTSATEFTLTATDAVSGVAHTYYRINGGDWIEYVSAFKLVGPDGTYVIDYYSVDVACNQETPKSKTVILTSLTVDSYLTDSDFNPITYFDVVFAKAKSGGYKLVATNPGQFYYNIEVTNNWPIAVDTLTIAANLPEDFVLKGAVPIHVYLDGMDITDLCTIDGTIFTVTNVPAGSMVYITVHVDYGLKYQYSGIIYGTFEEFGLKGYTFAVTVSGSGSAPGGSLIGTYTSSATLNAHQKKTTAIAGFVTDADGNPIVGALVELFDSESNGWFTYTDENGFYYFLDIPAGDYTVQVTHNGETYSQTTIAVSKELTQVDFKIE